ncbi:T9SS type B sorting domain-containing protein [Tenacibaculum geojense]|uniref:Gliding motility-associated C-terminal domain-containing protein n=1 Tax=Tenacibaculum geojense TaxID=915352 RepID=A0ABW3JUC2_9FLAO
MLFLSVGANSQELQAPVLNFSFACGSSSSNSFDFEFSFTGSAFNSDNVFIIELSDANGSFDNPTNAGSITGENNTFVDIPGSLNLPDDTYGQGYRIRIRSTSPASIGPESIAFEAYYRPDINLILEDEDGNRDIVLCGGSPQQVSLNYNNPDYEYVWFFNNNQLSETSSTLTITQPGEYYATLSAGQCTNSYPPSNKIFVTVADIENVSIEGDNTVQICANESYDLVASVDDVNYIYRWYKDNELIQGLPDYLPVLNTTDVNQYGVYYVEIFAGNCSARSQDVTVEPRTDAGFEVVLDSPSPRIILPSESFNLQATHDASNATFQWFRNGSPLPARTQSSMTVRESGEYFVEVTDTSGSCEFSVVSETIIVLDVVSFETQIRFDTNYTDCSVSQTTLSVVGIEAMATDGNLYSLSESQLTLLNYQWKKDSNDVSGATFEELNLSSYLDNGVYVLNASVGLIESDSNELPVFLTLEDVEIQSSSSSNSICPGGMITLSVPIESGFTYTWFKDGEALTVSDPSSIEVTEIGIYYVSFDGYGCQINVPEVEIVEFDDSVLEVSPSTTTVLTPGETVTISATGADSYEWYDEAGNLLSTTESLDVNTLGTYTLIGRVDDCLVKKTIEVVEDDGLMIIPNIITPFNGDGVNDTWQLPNRFAYQPEVRVIIYNSNGNVVVNTTDYQNDWPQDNNLKDGMLFYFKVIKDNNNIIKAGTISILK